MNEKTVLFVDDEESLLKSLKRTFLSQGCRVFTATSGDDGLQLLAQERVHLVVSDQRMPGMSGADFLMKVRERYPHTTRVIMSGYADIGAVIDSINKAHISHFLIKPWDTEELRSVVHKYLAVAQASREEVCPSPEYYCDLQSIIFEQQREIAHLRKHYS